MVSEDLMQKFAHQIITYSYLKVVLNRKWFAHDRKYFIVLIFENTSTL